MTPILRQTCILAGPCDNSTSAWRSFRMISSGLCFFPGIVPPLAWAGFYQGTRDRSLGGRLVTNTWHVVSLHVTNLTKVTVSLDGRRVLQRRNRIIFGDPARQTPCQRIFHHRYLL